MSDNRPRRVRSLSLFFFLGGGLVFFSLVGKRMEGKRSNNNEKIVKKRKRWNCTVPPRGCSGIRLSRRIIEQEHISLEVFKLLI